MSKNQGGPQAAFDGRGLPGRLLPVAQAISVAVCGAALCVALPGAAHAQAGAPAVAGAQQARSYRIPAGPLAPALRHLASSANVLLTFTAGQTDGKTTAGLDGQYTLPSALHALLAGTGLQAVALDNGGYVLRPIPTATPAPTAAGPGETTLAVVRVTAAQEAETAEGPVRGYAARRGATGTKTDTPLIETPQSISIIGAEQIETLRAQSIADAVAYSVGALRAPYTERTGDEITLRGFGVPMTFRDGVRYQANRFDGQQEPYGLERIEVLKGASSILYGAAEPGGVLNTVSKRPTAEMLREVGVALGSFARKQVYADFSGALTEDGSWSYRLTALGRDSGTSVDHVPDDRIYVAPALQWKPNGVTSLTLLAEYQRDHTAYVGDGLPTVGTALPNTNGRIARSRFTGEPGYDRYDTRRHSVGYLLEHQFSAQLRLRHSLRQYRVAQDWSAISIDLALDAAQRAPLARFAQDRVERNSLFTTDTAPQYDWQAAGVAHKTLLGVDVSRQAVNSGRYERSVGTLDLFTPVYGGSIGDAVPDYGWRARDRQVGIYLQDQMKIGERWVLLLGGRQDRVRQNDCDYFNPGECSVENEKTSAFTGRAGLVYLADNGLAPYASISESFQPAAGVDRTGSRFKPTEGRQYEVGVRYQPPGGQWLLSAAAYQLTQRNVLTEDPQDNRYQRQQGEVRSRGIEIEAKGKIGSNLQVLAAYNYTDARTTRASPAHPEEVGQRSAGVPYNQLSVWGDYHLGAMGLPGLRLGLGLRYVDETTNPWHEVRSEAYTVFDAMASYTTGPWRLALNITNLADKTYVASCPYRCFYGEPRKAIASATYRW